MILSPSSKHALFVIMIIIALLAPNCECDGTVICYNNGTANEKLLRHKAREASAYKRNNKNIVPAGSTDMIAIAREKARQEEASEFCRIRNASIRETKDGIKCIKTVKINNTIACTRTFTIQVRLKVSNVLVDRRKETNIYIAGNVVGFVFLVILLTTYSSFKELQTSYGICIVILSIIVIVKNVIQVFTYLSKRKSKVCKVVGISSHWLHLSMFCWMASIACDLLVTFSRVRLPSTAAQKRKLKKYMIFSFSAPTLVVLVCLIIDLSHTQLYGSHGSCFISQWVAYVASFIVPMIVALLFNMICMGCTIYFIRSASKASKSLSKHDNGKPSISFTIMAIKLSLLLGICWVIGYIGLILQSSALLYTFLILDSFQGMLIYFAFCCNRRVFQFYKRAFKAHFRHNEILTLSSKKETDAIDL